MTTPVRANILFRVVNERHRRHRSMIFTTNKSLKACGGVVHDDDGVAQAIIDRVLAAGSCASMVRPYAPREPCRGDESGLRSVRGPDQDFRKIAARCSGTHIFVWPYESVPAVLIQREDDGPDRPPARAGSAAPSATARSSSTWSAASLLRPSGAICSAHHRAAATLRIAFPSRVLTRFSRPLT
jgi:IstB-like ATP binding protein